MTDDDVVVPDEPIAPPARPRGHASRNLAFVLAAVLGVTTVLLAIAAVSYKSDRDAQRTDQQDLELAASGFAQAFVDSDDDLASLVDDVVPLSVDPFLEEFQSGADEFFALGESLGHQSTRATIQEVYTTSTSGDTARAIIVYDATTTFEDGRTVTNENQFMRLGMVQTDDGWKVNQVVDLLAVLSQQAQDAGTATSEPPSG